MSRCLALDSHLWRGRFPTDNHGVRELDRVSEPRPGGMLSVPDRRLRRRHAPRKVSMKRLLLYSLAAVLLVASEPAIAAVADLLPADESAATVGNAIGWLTSVADAGAALPSIPRR